MAAVAVGLGSAARRTSSTSKRESSKIGIFWAGKYIYIIVTPLLLLMDLK